MPRPNLASISINNNSRFDSDTVFITQRLIYVRCTNIIKKHVLRNNYSSSNSTPPGIFFSSF